MTKLIDKRIDTNINDTDLNLDINFYRSNGMPALSLVTERDEPYKDLTTNYNEEIYVDKCITVRSDEPENYRILLENGWIRKDSVCSIPQGFIEIVFYELTKEAYNIIADAAQEQGEEYPK